MLESFLFALIVFLLVILVYREEVNKQERKDLLRMIKADTLDEVTRAEMSDKLEEQEDIPPEFEALEAVDDDKFMQALEGQDGTR